jgi:hypothetical protein
MYAAMFASFWTSSLNTSPLRVRTEIHESRAKRRVSSMIEAA